MLALAPRCDRPRSRHLLLTESVVVPMAAALGKTLANPSRDGNTDGVAHELPSGAASADLFGGSGPVRVEALQPLRIPDLRRAKRHLVVGEPYGGGRRDPEA